MTLGEVTIGKLPATSSTRFSSSPAGGIETLAEEIRQV